MILPLPFLDHLSSQVNLRFVEDNMNLLHGSYGLPSSLSQVDWSEKFSVLLSLYKGDLSEPRYLQTELKAWESKWEMYSGTPPSKIADLLPQIER